MWECLESKIPDEQVWYLTRSPWSRAVSAPASARPWSATASVSPRAAGVGAFLETAQRANVGYYERQLEGSGTSWGIFMEGMDQACSTRVTYDSTATGGQYALKHNPGLVFPSVADNITMCAKVKPYTAFDGSTLPAVSFIAPNICDDMHGSQSTLWTNCLPGSGALYARGDAWLKARVPGMLAAGAVVFITFDESGVLYAVEVGPGVPIGTDANAYTHYSLLAAIESCFGLAKLGGASTARPLPLG